MTNNRSVESKERQEGKETFLTEMPFAEVCELYTRVAWLVDHYIRANVSGDLGVFSTFRSDLNKIKLMLACNAICKLFSFHRF